MGLLTQGISSLKLSTDAGSCSTAMFNRNNSKKNTNSNKSDFSTGILNLDKKVSTNFMSNFNSFMA